MKGLTLEIATRMSNWARLATSYGLERLSNVFSRSNEVLDPGGSKCSKTNSFLSMRPDRFRLSDAPSETASGGWRPTVGSRGSPKVPGA